MGTSAGESTAEFGPPRAAATTQRRRFSLTAGGTDGNEQLTAITGSLLVLLLAALGVTILRIGQLMWLHLFLGLLLIGPVALKMASTGYRFMRYYTRNLVYRAKGPPPPILRLIAPVVVLTTVLVLVTGVILLAVGPDHRGNWVLIHKVAFIVWIAFTALHVLGHLPGLGTTLRSAASAPRAQGVPGRGGRWLALTGALVAGLVLAIVLIPDFAVWTAPSAIHHHH
jgi:hypothetical protein